VHERAAEALALLDGITVPVSVTSTASRRRRHNQAQHALEAARCLLRRLCELTGEPGKT
jgi:hypothetical protein